MLSHTVHSGWVFPFNFQRKGILPIILISYFKFQNHPSFDVDLSAQATPSAKLSLYLSQTSKLINNLC